jgi:ABC-type transport system involved in cytochrome c biogenesis ATPase subunit
VLLAYALVAAGAGTLVMMYAVCFAAKGPACHAYWERLSPGRTGIGERGWSLLVAFVFTLSFISLLWALGELCTLLLDCRRSARLRTRVREVLDGVTTRSQAALKMHAGLGRVMHLVHDASLAVRLSFECISYRLSDGTYVLSDASGVVEPDEITVVMGPSGCGKSTLLSLLSGKLRPTRGTIFLNGKPGSVREMYKLIGFVPQEDVMLTSLTVMELLWFSAICRLPRDLPRATLTAWVHMVLDLLGLTQHRHKRIGDAQRRGMLCTRVRLEDARRGAANPWHGVREGAVGLTTLHGVQRCGAGESQQRGDLASIVTAHAYGVRTERGGAAA